MRYFIGKDGRQLGPFDARQVGEQLAAGAFSPDDLVWREGMAGWAPLRTEFASTPPASIASPGGHPEPAPPPSLYPGNAYNAPSSAPTKAGFVLGCVNLITWFIPLIGLPLSIWGLVASIKAVRQGGGGLAIAGLVLNIVALVLSVANAAIGAYLGATGRHPLIR